MTSERNEMSSYSKSFVQWLAEKMPPSNQEEKVDRDKLIKNAITIIQSFQIDLEEREKFIHALPDMSDKSLKKVTTALEIFSDHRTEANEFTILLKKNGDVEIKQSSSEYTMQKMQDTQKLKFIRMVYGRVKTSEKIAQQKQEIINNLYAEPAFYYSKQVWIKKAIPKMKKADLFMLLDALRTLRTKPIDTDRKHEKNPKKIVKKTVKELEERYRPKPLNPFAPSFKPQRR